MLSIGLLLVVLALVFTILSAVGKFPLWIPVLLLVLVHLVGAVPFR